MSIHDQSGAIINIYKIKWAKLKQFADKLWKIVIMIENLLLIQWNYDWTISKPYNIHILYRWTNLMNMNK